MAADAWSRAAGDESSPHSPPFDVASSSTLRPPPTPRRPAESRRAARLAAFERAPENVSRETLGCDTSAVLATRGSSESRGSPAWAWSLMRAPRPTRLRRGVSRETRLTSAANDAAHGVASELNVPRETGCAGPQFSVRQGSPSARCVSRETGRRSRRRLPGAGARAQLRLRRHVTSTSWPVSSPRR